MQKLRSIQMLRGVAVTAVLVHHAYRFVDPNSAARLGAAGVDLFFVISGFIMATIGPGRSAEQFILDRIWRIYPMWLIAAAPWVIVRGGSSGALLTTLTLWPIWGGLFHAPVLLLGWTLCFEMLFYAAFALGLLTRPIVPLALFLTCFAIGPRTPLLWFVGSPMILEFLSGVLIAQLPASRKGWLFVVAGLLWFAAAPVVYYEEAAGYGALLRVLSWGIPAALLVYGARGLEERVDGSAFDLPVLIGNSSFSIYLFHRLVVQGAAWWPLKIVGGIAIGVAIYWLLERRIMRMKPRLRSHRDNAVERAIADAGVEGPSVGDLASSPKRGHEVA